MSKRRENIKRLKEMEHKVKVKAKVKSEKKVSIFKKKEEK